MPEITKQQTAEAHWTTVGAGRNLICPVPTALNVLGGKCKLLILSYLLEESRRYGELRRLMPEITEKMLIQELRDLEADGMWPVPCIRPCRRASTTAAPSRGSGCGRYLPNCWAGACNT